MKTPAKPANAKAAIVATLIEDQTDIQSDYFGHRTEKTVLIGYRTGSREDFRQLRKAAASFPETAHMGPGKDDYRPRVVLLDDVRPGNGSCYWSGQYSHWHGELDGSSSEDHRYFTTEAEALAFIAEKGEPENITFQTDSGEQEVRFGWSIGKESIEHRDNYSMGAGNYLQVGWQHTSGWRVSSAPLTADGELPEYLLRDLGMTVEPVAPARTLRLVTTPPPPFIAPDFGGLEILYSVN